MMKTAAIPFSHIIYYHFITFLFLAASTPIKETQRGLNGGWYLLHPPPPLVVVQGRFDIFTTFFFRDFILYSDNVTTLGKVDES